MHSRPPFDPAPPRNGHAIVAALVAGIDGVAILPKQWAYCRADASGTRPQTGVWDRMRACTIRRDDGTSLAGSPIDPRSEPRTMTAPIPQLPVPDPATDPGAFVDAAAAVAGLAIDPAHRPGVIVNMRLAMGMAALVMGVTLTTADEPAPVFVPPGVAS
jgi:hypothetical protein